MARTTGGFNDPVTGQAQNRAMARVVTFAQSLRHEPLEALRALIVYGCALALIAPLPLWSR